MIVHQGRWHLSYDEVHIGVQGVYQKIPNMHDNINHDNTEKENKKRGCKLSITLLLSTLSEL